MAIYLPQTFSHTRYPTTLQIESPFYTSLFLVQLLLMMIFIVKELLLKIKWGTTYTVERLHYASIQIFTWIGILQLAFCEEKK